MSASAYYQRATGQRSARAVEDERLLGPIEEIHAANYYAYGYRRMWQALRRAGETSAACRVKRLMRANGIQGAKRRGKPWRTTTPDPQAHRRPDLVDATSPPQRPGRAVGRRLHLPALLGGRACSSASSSMPTSRRVVGWQFAQHMRTDLVLDALRMALDPPPAAAPTSS